MSETPDEIAEQERVRRQQAYMLELQNELHGGDFALSLFKGSNSVGLNSAGLTSYNFMAGIVNWFAGLFGFTEPVLSPIETVDDIINLMHSGTDNPLRESVQEMLTQEMNLPPMFAEALLEPTLEAREALDGLLAAAGITEISDFDDIATLRQKMLSPAAIRYLLTSEKTEHLLMQMVPESMQASFTAARRSGELQNIDFDALSLALQNPAGKDFNTIIGEAILATVPFERKIDIFVASLSEEQKEAGAAAIAFLQANLDKIETIFGQEGIDQIIRIAQETGEIPDFSNLPTLLANPNFAALKETLFARILANNDVEEALLSMDFSAMPEAQNLVEILTSASDVEGATNLDIIAGLDGALSQKLIALLPALLSEEPAPATVSSLTPDEKAALDQAITEMDFDNVAAAREQVAIHANISDAAQVTANVALNAVGIKEGLTDNTLFAGIQQRLR